MPWSISSDQYLRERLSEVTSRFKTIKQQSDNAHAKLTNDVLGIHMVSWHENFRASRARIVQLFNNPPTGFLAYIKDQMGDQSFDPTAETLLITNAMQAVIDEIEVVIPVDANGFHRNTKFISGKAENRSFPPAQTANLRIKLADLRATIS